ncbi:cryptochrome/photolyase family protein [Brunnivagina elsteri]|uniref:Cryptochrome/photolyase family protein n=1 Tax=Brunnivagina elsteri CCALA 953 TaxID=987040 RepID=A0A2A2TGG3_9CYAN|nr:cryptochrome/photolyase family protein [Calothrix elsteri]PAX52725.1 cryptochrome/photolyase family protein [Calothrix elsteri CCALA 953]
MTIGVWILGNQLSTTQAALVSCGTDKIPVILIESLNHVQVRPYHKQKLVLIWSAMRHFAEELREKGYKVTYEITDDFAVPLEAWIKANKITEMRVMIPADRPFMQLIKDMERQYFPSLECKINLVPNNHFLWTTEAFKSWAQGRKSLLMEYFYREGRRKFQILMAGDKPVGGEWNYDKENRQRPKGKLNTPGAKWFEPNEITQEVIKHVNSLNISTFGKLNDKSNKFYWGVNRSQALEVLDWFIHVRLAGFGPYQDAMIMGEETMWHSMISPYLNIGLLHPLEVVEAAEKAYREEQIPLNSGEGFIRQVLGWREYMYGLYHYVSEDYSQNNYFNHKQPLPEFFWTGETKMNCLHQVISQLLNTGYVHHIQRLMILSNFALITGLSPQEVESWFHSAFIDGYDWVMQTNVIGMGLFADGGILGSKPYAASANYINKMSNYCKGCSYNYKARTGDNACPFNFFYWDFLDRHREKLATQGRMSFILNNLDKMPVEELEAIRKLAGDWLFLNMDLSHAESQSRRE